MTYQYDVVIVGGCGRVGLPLGLFLADKGLKVLLCDTNVEAGLKVRRKTMPFCEKGSQEILERVADVTLFYKASVPFAEVLKQAPTIIVCIGTPVDEYAQPRFLKMVEFFQEMAPHLQDDQHVMLRSTVYPGTFRRLQSVLKHRASLSYCPERIVEGQALQELPTLPQICSGSPAAEIFFQRVGIKTVWATPEQAELAKLYLNAWRYLQFACANEFYRIAEERGVEYQEVDRVMREGYERANGLPGPGFAAGPCLLKDTMQIAASDSRGFPLGQAARQVNEGLPDLILKTLSNYCRVGQETSILYETQDYPVGVLGMSFKREVDDIRDSLSFKLVKAIRFKGHDVLCSDEYAAQEGWVSAQELVKRCCIIIVAVPHDAYRGMDLTGRYVVDLWNITKGGTSI